MKKHPKIGLALGSGGARGWCHIGVLRGLGELGVTPDLVAGCSMGALVGVAWSAGKLDALEDWARALTRTRFVALMDVRLGSGGLVEARQIETLLRDMNIADQIEDLPRPFAAVATDMETGREVWLTDGPTHPAVRASVGIPGVMSPIRHRDTWLLDGGLTNPVPVSTVRAMGAEVIIAVNPNAKPMGRFWTPPATKSAQSWAAEVLPNAWHEALGIDADAPSEPGTPNYIDVLTASVEMMENQICRARLAGEPPHFLLNAAFDGLSVLELYRAAEAIDEGRRMVDMHAEAIRSICGLTP